MGNPIGNPMAGVAMAIGEAVDVAYAAKARSAVNNAVDVAYEWKAHAEDLQRRIDSLLAKNKKWEVWGIAAEKKINELEAMRVRAVASVEGLVAVKDALLTESRDCPNAKHHRLAYSEEARARIHISVSGGIGLTLPPELSHLSTAPARLSGG